MAYLSFLLFLLLTGVIYGLARLLGFKPKAEQIMLPVGTVLVWLPTALMMLLLWGCVVGVICAVVTLTLHLFGLLPFVAHLLSDREWKVLFLVFVPLSYVCFLGYHHRKEFKP